ncbi:unnamed protein product [Ectocarpus sp. 6 AP-2014]
MQAPPANVPQQPPARPPLVASKWTTLLGSQLETKVPVALFVLCKTVVEDDQGALYLNATVVQRVPLETTSPMPPQDQLEKDLLFEMKVKGPSAGGGITSRRKSVEDVREQSQHTVMVCETLDLKTAPLDVRQHWNWFPFRILKATIDLELQAKNVDVGGTKVLFCPDLCASKKKDNVAKVQTRGSLSRSNKLTFLQEQPIVHIVQDRRFKKNLEQAVKDGHKKQVETYQADVEAGRAPTVANPDDNLFVTYPLMRLTFYLYEPPAKAMFKIVGPLFLILYLMLMNFNEFYGLRNIWDDGCPGEERDSDYLANGIGIAITAAFVVPAIRADRMKSPYISFTRDDLMAVAFLIGLALSTSPYCHWVISGCFVSFLVVVSAVVASVCHYFKCKHLRKTVDQRPPVTVEASSKEVKATSSEFNMSEWFHASV